MHYEQTQAETWAFYVPKKIPNAVPGIIELGRVLLEAKTILPPAEFDRLFNDRLVPFGRRTANELLQIAEHPALTNPTHRDVLPNSWTILGVLSSVAAELLDPAIRDGRVHLKMSRHEATRLCRALRPTRKDQEPVVATRVFKSADREARLEKIRELAAEGARSDQIAAAVHLHVQTIRQIMKKAGIECVADRVVGKSRHLDANRILDHLVHSASSIAADVHLIDFDKLDPAPLPDYITSLRQSVKATIRLTTRLEHVLKERYAAKTKLAVTG